MVQQLDYFSVFYMQSHVVQHFSPYWGHICYLEFQIIVILPIRNIGSSWLNTGFPSCKLDLLCLEIVLNEGGNSKYTDDISDFKMSILLMKLDHVSWKLLLRVF